MTLRSKSPNYSRCSRGLLSIGSRSDAGSYKRLPTQEPQEPQQPREPPMVATSCVDSYFHEAHGEDAEKAAAQKVARHWRDGPEILESWPVQGVTIMLILANAIVIGFETDMPDLCRWDVVENGFLVAFTFELVVRLYCHGFRAYFRVHSNPDIVWNIFDLCIVSTGICNLVVVAALGSKHNVGKDASLFRIVRLLRILRVLRIIRIVRFLKQLYLLAYGFIEGTMAVFWVTLLASFMLYICSVVLVRTYGRMEGEEGVDEADAEFFAEHFGSISRTMFSLFELISAPDLRPYRAIMFKNPPLVLFLITFIILGSFGINGLLVALINESILEKNQARLEADRMDRESKRKVMQARCRELFDSLDVNKNRVLPRNELISCTAQLAQIFESLGVAFQRKDLDQMFYIMDYNDTGIIERSEFVQGVLELCDQIRPMSIMELHYQVSKCVNKLEQADSKVDAVVKAGEQHDLRLDRLQLAVDRQRRLPLLDAALTTRSSSSAAASTAAPLRPGSQECHAVGAGALQELLLDHASRLREASTQIEGLAREPATEIPADGLQGLSEALLGLQRSNVEVLGALLQGWSPTSPAEPEASAPALAEKGRRRPSRAATTTFDCAVVVDCPASSGGAAGVLSGVVEERPEGAGVLPACVAPSAAADQLSNDRPVASNSRSSGAVEASSSTAPVLHTPTGPGQAAELVLAG